MTVMYQGIPSLHPFTFLMFFFLLFFFLCVFFKVLYQLEYISCVITDNDTM